MIEGFTVIIPARFASSRLPGKPLRLLGGRPMIEHVHRRAVESGAQRVVVATDDRRIAEACDAFGAQCLLTSVEHASGTDRVAEAAARLGLAPEAVVVNLQGDEPLMPPELLRIAAQSLEDAPVATLALPIEDPAEVASPHAVKVVLNARGHALYFSRAAIPFDRDAFGADGHPGEHFEPAGDYLRHLGIYAYRAEFLARYRRLSASPLERRESLEQLRVLWAGEPIRVAVVEQRPPPGVDIEEDLTRAERWLGVR